MPNANVNKCTLILQRQKSNCLTRPKISKPSCETCPSNRRPCQLKNSLFVEYSALFHVLFDKFADFPVQAVRGPVAGRSADKTVRFADLMFCRGDFTRIFRQ